MTAVGILGAAFFSTHHASASDALAGRPRPFTAPGYELLVGRARRFTSLVTQLHVEVCGALRCEPDEPPLAVFATCHGEIQTAEKLIADFRASRMVSSARFALSVHNTASGVYAVAVGSAAATTTVTGGNAIAAGWLEAALTAIDSGRRVLLSIADEAVPAVFAGPGEPAGVAAAFLLGPAGRRAELAIVPSAAPELADGAALHVLAGASAAVTADAAASFALGAIQPGHALELRFLAGRARVSLGPVTDYLPHRPPMLLIDELVELSGERAVCRATLRPDCVFAVDGVVHPSAMIELVAQACAVLAGATGGGGPRVGLIVACREVDFAVDGFAVGDALTVTAIREASQPQLAVFTGTVVRDGAACVTMTLSVADAALAAAPTGGDA